MSHEVMKLILISCLVSLSDCMQFWFVACEFKVYPKKKKISSAIAIPKKKIMAQIYPCQLSYAWYDNNIIRFFNEKK